MEDSTDANNLRCHLSEPDKKQVNLAKSEDSALIEERSMPEIINTRVSSTSSKEREAGTKLSTCYEVRHGAEVAAKKVKSGCIDYWSSTCSIDNLKQKLPIMTWLPKYSLKTFKCDFIAGLTVGLTVIPQGMAYAALAGLELQVYMKII